MRFPLSISILTIITVSACASVQQSTQQSPINQSPNIVLVVTDDQGWGDFGFTGNSIVQTPTLDRLAEDGMFFERFYVSPVCAPTRASLLTGRDALRTGVFYVTRNGEALPEDEVTLAEVLKSAGYSTGAFGKWHNGSHFPQDPIGQGFDTFVGFSSGHLTRYFDPELKYNGKIVRTDGYIADTITDAAIDFIRDNSGQPFFAYVALNTPHSPFELKNRDFAKYSRMDLSDLDASVYGMVDNIDQNMGRLLEALEAEGLRERTVFIFLSDNGPAFPGGQRRFNGGLKGGKGDVDDGGVRVPLLVHWPGRVESGTAPAGLAFQHVDLFPTILALAGVDQPEDVKLDGVDLSDRWLGESSAGRGKLMFTSRMQNTKWGDEIGVASTPGAVRSDRWAAIVSPDGKWSLFDLLEDPGQQNNVANSQPQILQELASAYRTWFASAVEEGKPHYLPIEIGHPGLKSVELPAHEALLFGPGIAYAHEWGWSHDWITNWDSSEAEAVWPLDVVRPGRYHFEIAYQADTTQWKRQVTISVGSVGLRSTLPGPHIARQIPDNRRFETGEAPELNWKWASLGYLDLPSGQAKLRMRLDKSEGNGPDVKAIRVSRIDSDDD